MEYHLAQVNIAKMLADLNDPIMSGFVNRLDEINSLADSSPGFVWRFQTDQGDATYLRPYDDDTILFNMSVWESIDTLKSYVYNSTHLELIQSKKNWFSKLTEPHMALWWIAKGHIPDVDEGLAKIELIKHKGVSESVFTFSNPINPPNFPSNNTLFTPKSVS